MDMNLDVSVNREFKDTIFTWLFNNREALLELYNAIRGTNYGADADVFITTLENVLSYGRHNDLSFVLDNRLVVLIEHQSTLNNNMPLRMLLYVAAVYEKWLDKNVKGAIFRERMMEIPLPEFIVLYNGVAPMADEVILKLSDMFKKHGVEYPINLELVVRVININKGHNEDLAQKSETLNGYETLIDKFREYGAESGKENAALQAIRYCLENNILREFLETHKTEVCKMLLTEWKEEDAHKVWREEALEEGRELGREEGIEIGMEKGMVKVAKKMKYEGIDASTITRLTGLAIEDVLKL
jgi:predicted transposase YdaD